MALPRRYQIKPQTLTVQHVVTGISFRAPFAYHQLHTATLAAFQVVLVLATTNNTGWKHFRETQERARADSSCNIVSVQRERAP